MQINFNAINFFHCAHILALGSPRSMGNQDILILFKIRKLKWRGEYIFWIVFVIVCIILGHYYMVSLQVLVVLVA